MPPARSIRTESVQHRAWLMHEAGSSIEDICETVGKTKEDVRQMIYRARKQIAKASQ